MIRLSRIIIWPLFKYRYLPIIFFRAISPDGNENSFHGSAKFFPRAARY